MACAHPVHVPCTLQNAAYFLCFLVGHLMYSIFLECVKRVHYILMPCIPCIFLLRTLCRFQARSKHATYVFFFTLKSDVCFLLGVWGVCADHIHFLHHLCTCCASFDTPCARPCTPMHAPSIKYVRTVFTLLYPIYSTFFNLRSVHSPSTLRASCPACPMHAPCTPFA